MKSSLAWLVTLALTPLTALHAADASAPAKADRATIGGRRLSGQKGTMLEGGALVPLIANWPGVTPSGKVVTSLIDSTDFVPTFAEVAQIEIATSQVLDGQSLFAHWCHGVTEPRNWAWVRLARKWYVREASWKLNQAGELFDMSDAPFDGNLVAVDTSDSATTAARKRLQAVLDQFNPASDILDNGDGTGRYAHKDNEKKSVSEAARDRERTVNTRSEVTHAQRPNVLFIAVDDMRPELGCYGNKVVKTPQIDRLAARGIVFERAYCLQAVCSPSRTAILTGLRPDTTKVWDLETHFRAAVPDCVTLPQHFKANGYHCSSLGKIYHGGFEDGRSWNEPHWYPKGRAVDTDLDDWSKQIVTTHNVTTEEYATPDVGGPKDAKGRTKRGPAYEVSPKQDDELPDGATAAEAVKRIQALKAKAQPFFLAVGFLKPHLPFVAPKRYWDLYDPRAIPVPATDKLPEGCPSFAGHTNGELHNYPGVPTQNPIPDEFARTLRHGYYACLSYTDAQIGRLLDALEQTGQLDNTIIVLWGDHGWQLGEHGLWHKHTNFEVAARSPLLISVPKTKTAGQKCAAPVEFVDVSPTLTDLCGLPAQSGLAGLSLKRYIENPAAPMQKVAISQYPRSAGPGSGQVMGYSIRNERFRATFWRERKGSQIVATELYDEQNDPHETVSLAEKPEHQVLLAALQKHLPPVGSDTPPTTKGPTPRAVTQTAAPADETRDARFTRLYPGKQKLTLPEYLAAQGKDVAAATERFKKMDKNGDGSLTRAEFVGESKQN